MTDHFEPRRKDIDAFPQPNISRNDRNRTYDLGLAHGIALLERIHPRQAVIALVGLTTGTDIAAALAMRWDAIDEISGHATLYDRGLMFERVVPLPKITYDAIRRLPFDGRDSIFAKTVRDAWPYRLVMDLVGGGVAEVSHASFEEGFLRTAGRLRMLQTVVDRISPPPFAVRSGQVERYSDVVEAVTAHFAPLIRDARRAVAGQRIGNGHDVSS